MNQLDLSLNYAPPIPKPDRPVISMVLTFFNEEHVLPELVRRLRAVLRGEQAKNVIGRYELVFINDASTDQSEAILLEAAKEAGDIKIITMSRNWGIFHCLQAGMAHASGDAIIYMDADLQDPPEVIPEVLRAWKADPDVEVVHTVRSSRRGEPPLKLWLTRLAYKIIRFVSTVELQVEAGDFKLLSRRAVNELLRLREKRPYLRGLACWIGFKQTTVPYDRDARYAGRSKFPLFDRRVMRYFMDTALIAFSDVPLQLSIVFGFLMSFCAFCYLVFVLIQKFLGQNLPGWSALMVALLFLGGIQLLSIGILGLYISSIYLETKCRPNYIIAHRYGFPENSPASRLPAGHELPDLRATKTT